jgi:hypothetical protein
VILRAKVLEICVAGLCAGGFSGGIALLIRLGYPADATLGFLGGIVGAAATVLGAIWIQDARTKGVRLEEQAFLTRSLRPLRERFAELATVAADEGATEAALVRAAEVCTNFFDGARSIVEDVIKTTTVLDLPTKAILRHTIFSLDAFSVIYANEVRDAHAHNGKLDRQILSNLARAMELTVERALSQLEGRG